MSRIKTADKAGTTYKGSAKGAAKFTPQKAASKDKANKERKAALNKDIKAEQLELQQVQAAQTLELKSRQIATSGQLKVGQLQETAKLKMEHLQDAANLTLLNQSKESQANLEVSKVQYDGGLKSANLNLINSIAQLSLSFAGKALDYSQVHQANKAKQASVTELFGLVDNGTSLKVDTAKAEETDFTQQIINGEKAIDKVAGADSQLANTLREDTQNQILARQTRELTVNQANEQLPGYMKTFMGSDIKLHTPDGRTITPLTVSNQQDLNWVIKQGFSIFAQENGLDKMPTAQLASVLAPTARQIMQNTSARIGQEIVTNRIEEAKLNAKEMAMSNLSNGMDISDVYQKYAAQLFASGGYRGARGQAGEDALLGLIDYAKATNREDIIEKLRLTYKVYKGDGTPNSGTQFGKIATGVLDQADLEIAKNKIKLLEDTKGLAKFDVQETLNDRLADLAEAGDDEDKQNLINQNAINTLENLGTNEGRLEAQRLKNLGTNYSPYTYTSMVEAVETDGATYSNEELAQLVLNRDLKVSEAQALGWRPNEKASVDDATNSIMEKFNVYSTSKSMSTALVKTVMDRVVDLEEVDKANVTFTLGANLIGNLDKRIQTEVVDFLKANPEASATDIRTKLNEINTSLTQEISGVSFDTDSKSFRGYYWDGTSPEFETGAVVKMVRETGSSYLIFSNRSTKFLQENISDIEPLNDQLLTRTELMEAASGKFSQRVKDVAFALNTNPETLVRMQARAYRLEESAYANLEFPDIAGIDVEITRSNIKELSLKYLGKKISWRQYKRDPSVLTNIADRDWDEHGKPELILKRVDGK
tara:strand:+ start:24627 stop:27095 length:2469 start_codon:yes stop_codon:yes gene_type:complete